MEVLRIIASMSEQTNEMKNVNAMAAMNQNIDAECMPSPAFTNLK